MNCNNDINQYKGTETFEFDGVTYNKVKITSGWNRIGLRYFISSTLEITYFEIYTIPEGEYDVIELYKAIAECLSQFGNLVGGISVNWEEYDPATSGSNPFPSKTFTGFLNRYRFVGMSSYSDNYIDIVAVPNGIQTILPFTLPMPFVHNKNANYASRNSRFSNIIQIYNSGYFFNMIWMHLYFFYHKIINCQYPNNFIGFMCNYYGGSLFSDLKTGSPRNYTDIVYALPPSIYSEYGYLIAMLTAYVNSSASGNSEKLRFIIYEDNEKILIQRSGSDNKWGIPPTTKTTFSVIANHEIRDYSTSYMFNYITFIIDKSEVKDKYINTMDNICRNNYNNNTSLKRNIFYNNYNINPTYIKINNNKIIYENNFV